MRTKHFVCLLATAAILSSCTMTIPATSKSKMNETVEDVKVQLKQQGYFSSGFSSEQTTFEDYGASKSGSTAGSTELKSNATGFVDTYRFENDGGDQMSFQIKYIVNDKNNVMYVADVSVLGCQTSKVKDYENMCGNQSPIRKLESMPQDGIVEIPDPTSSMWAYIGIGGGLVVAALMFALNQIQ